MRVPRTRDGRCTTGSPPRGVTPGHGPTSGPRPPRDLNASLAMLGDPEWQRTSSPSERARLAGPPRVRAGGRSPGHRRPDGLRAAIRPGRVPRRGAACGRHGHRHLHARARDRRGGPDDADRRVVGDHPRRSRDGCADAPLPRQQHLPTARRPGARRDRGARANGSPVTVETYPYGAGSTAIGAYFLAPERLPAWGLRPTDSRWWRPASAIADLRRLEELRVTDPGAVCVVRFLDEDDPSDARDAAPVPSPSRTPSSPATRCRALARRLDRLTRVAPSPGRQTHPRTAGTFARSLRRMVRESGVWTWAEAFRRCSYLPAQLRRRLRTLRASEGLARRRRRRRRRRDRPDPPHRPGDVRRPHAPLGGRRPPARRRPAGRPRRDAGDGRLPRTARAGSAPGVAHHGVTPPGALPLANHRASAGSWWCPVGAPPAPH